MKKFYCPWCGERAFSVFNKVEIYRWSYVFRPIANKLWFTCPNCGKEVDKQLSEVIKKRYLLLMICTLLFSLLCGLFIVLKMWVLMFCSLFIMIPFSIIDSILIYKYDVYVRRNPVTDNDVIAAARIDLKVEFIEEQIYIIRPAEEYRNKLNVRSMYIVALSNYSREDGTCDVRFVKPQEASGLIAARKFKVYDDEKLVGDGWFTDKSVAHVVISGS